MTDVPSISGIDDASQVRIMLYQSGRQVHAPALGIGLAAAGSISPASDFIYDTVADLTAATIDAAYERITTLGYYAAGDGGGTAYVRNNSAAVFITSADGQKWQIAERIIHNVRHYGAKGDGTTNDQSAITNALNEAIAAQGTLYFPTVANPAGFGYRGSIIVNDLVGLRVKGDGYRASVLTHFNTAIDTMAITGTTSGDSADIIISGLHLNGTTGQRGLFINNCIGIGIELLRVFGPSAAEGSVGYATSCYFYGSATLPGFRAGVDNITTTGFGQFVFVNCSFANQSATGVIPALEIIGHTLGLAFISCGFAAAPTGATVTINGPTGHPEGYSSVNFYDCHGESNHNAANNGADFIIGQTTIVGHVGFYGGNFWGHGDGTNYRQDWLRVYKCMDLVVDGVEVSKLGFANGYSRAMIRLETGFPAAGNHYMFRSLTALDSIPVYSDANGVLTTYTGLDYNSTAPSQPLDADLTSWAGVTRAAGFDTFAATPSSANLATLVTGETGSGALVFGTSPIIDSLTATGANLSHTYVDAGAGAMEFIQFRDSATPAAADQLAYWRVRGRDSLANVQEFGLFAWSIVDATSGSEDSRLEIYNYVAGAATLQLFLTATGTQIPALGVTNPGTGNFTTLAATAAVTLSPANANVVISPTGTGIVTINPATAGTINNASIGVTTPLAVRGTTLQATNWFGTTAPVTKTADFTIAATENYLINNKAAATCVVTLPAAASFTGRIIVIKTIQAQLVNSASSNVVPLAGGAAAAAILAATAGRWAQLVSNGSNWEIMAGN